MEIISTPGFDRLPPPPSYYDRRRKLRGNKDERSDIRNPEDLLGLPDEQFAQATQGARWRRLWEG